MSHRSARAVTAAGAFGLLFVAATLALSPLRPSLSGPAATAPRLAGPLETLYDGEPAPVFARCELPSADALASAPGNGALAKAAAADPDRALCAFFLSSLAPRFQASDPERAFRIEEGGKEGTRAWYRVRQLEQGVPVYGGEGRVAVPRGAQGGEARYLGRFRTVPGRLSAPIPALDAAEALAAARRDLASGGALDPVPADLAGEPSPLETAPELVWLPAEAPERPRNPYVSPAPAPFRLAWNLAVRPNFLELWEYLVDAETGAILLKLPVHCAFGPATATARDLHGVQRTFGTWQHTDGKYYLIDAARPMYDPGRSTFPDLPAGALVTLDLANTMPSAPAYRHLTSATNAWNHPLAVSAHTHATLAYEYFRAAHGRNSINGLGGTIRSFVNVVGPDGLAMDNAYWNGNGMFYGNGRVSMTPLAASLDVSGHEMTHGVVSATAGLRYRGQSGALNESFADIFGALIEGEDWKIGEDIVKREVFTSGAMRDMADPTQSFRRDANGNWPNGWQPGHMNDYVVLPTTTAGDYGGVHANSGIPNRAFYLYANAVGRDKAGQVFYRALSRYLGASSQFTDLRLAVKLSAQDLYGAPEAAAAENAFAAVGIGAPGPGPAPSRLLNAVAGPQYALVTRAGPGDGNTLYLLDSAWRNPRPLSRTAVRSRPSVADDGSFAIFVSREGRILRVTLDPAAPAETVVENNPVWSQAAVSKDGRRWAAVKIARDTSLWIGDFAGAAPRRFTLYNAGGLGVRTAVYAASLDWDHGGENVIYDMFLRLSGNGASLEYWDVGLMKVWDKAAGRYDEGLGSKPFGDAAEGHRAGNPVFSKTRLDVVVYDQLSPDGSWSLAARDIETRRSGTLLATGMPGHPSCDRTDGGVAFGMLQGSDTVIAWLPLGPDRLSAAGAPRVVATGFKWPVIFAQGKRPATPVAARPLPAASSPTLKARYLPATRSLDLEYTLPEAAWVRLSVYGMDGRQLETLAVRRPAGAHRMDWSLGNRRAGPGVYVVALEAAGVRARAVVMAAE